jgi:CubicO group peptidase (beta-lactamase class C family)
MKYLLYIAGLILISVSCQHQPEKRDLKGEHSKKIHQLILQAHNSGSFDGTILIADSTGVVYQAAFGLADREKKVPLNTETLFYLASVSKQFTATAILLLQQQGKIQLNDRIIKYLPELPPIYAGITFIHLLNHTSGIPDYYEFTELHDGFTNDDVLKVLLEIDSLEFEPGARYKYSNSGYVLLSILSSRISGESFANYLKENALDKAGLKYTVVYDEEAAPLTTRAIGYGQDGTDTDYRFRTTGGGGIFSNVEDLYQWHLALTANRILRPDIQQLAYEPAILNNDSTVYYGFGWQIDPGNLRHVSHGGELEGFRTFFDRYLNQQMVIILLSNNSCERLQEMSDEIHQILNMKAGILESSQ